MSFESFFKILDTFSKLVGDSETISCIVEKEMHHCEEGWNAMIIWYFFTWAEIFDPNFLSPVNPDFGSILWADYWGPVNGSTEL